MRRKAKWFGQMVWPNGLAPGAFLAEFPLSWQERERSLSIPTERRETTANTREIELFDRSCFTQFSRFVVPEKDKRLASARHWKQFP